MSRHILRAIVLATVLLAAGCGVTNKVAVNTMTPILESALDAAFRDRDLDTVRDGIPANLLLIRGMAEANPDEVELRVMATQAYFSYSMAFIEDFEPDRAELLYVEGLRLGREYLETQHWYATLASDKPIPSEESLAAIPEGQVPVLFWTVANWARWVSLNLDDPAAVAQLPRIEAYLQRIVDMAPEYYMGLPHVMVGSIQGFRPQMLGGKPEEARKNFEEAFRISGNRMLIYHVLYSQFYCRQLLDEDCFDENLRLVLDAPDDLLPEYQLWNEVAKDKAAYLLEIRDELF